MIKIIKIKLIPITEVTLHAIFDSGSKGEINKYRMSVRTRNKVDVSGKRKVYSPADIR